MILDKELEVTTAVALDLGAKRPGPGKPIKCIATGVSAAVVVTHDAVVGATADLMTIHCNGEDLVEFELPSRTLQFVMFTFADGEVNIVLEGNQTNV